MGGPGTWTPKVCATMAFKKSPKSNYVAYFRGPGTPSLHKPYTYTFTCRHMYMYVYLIYLSIYLSIYPSIYLSFSLSLSLSLSWVSGSLLSVAALTARPKFDSQLEETDLPLGGSRYSRSTWRLQCSSFLVMTYFVIRGYKLLPEKDLHRSLQVSF